MFVTDKAANNLAPVSKTGAITRYRLRLTTPGVIQCANDRGNISMFLTSKIPGRSFENMDYSDNPDRSSFYPLT